MKTTIITTILAFVALAGMAQTKVTKPDTAQLVISKADVPHLLESLNTTYAALQQSDKISSKQATEAEAVCQAIIYNIFRKWPEFIPKQPVTNQSKVKVNL